MASDLLTPAERLKLNGPVMEVKLNEPMSRETFLGLPTSLQKEYILHLQRTYTADDGMLAQMWGISSSAVALSRKALGIPSIGQRRSFIDREILDARWQRFLDGEFAAKARQELAAETENPTEFAPENTEKSAYEQFMERAERNRGPVDTWPSVRRESEDTKETEAEEPKKVAAEDDDLGFKQTELYTSFTGVFDPQKFLKLLSKLPMPDGKVVIDITVKSV